MRCPRCELLINLEAREQQKAATKGRTDAFDGENGVTADSPQVCKHIASRSQGQRVWRTTGCTWMDLAYGERVMVTSKVVLAIVRTILNA